MMPLASTPVVAVPSKPEISFSIDSIIGEGERSRSSPPLASPGSLRPRRLGGRRPGPWTDWEIEADKKLALYPS
ncbi:hypothetical protein EVAR_20295_1 [Eumeta japonica]|uniref:Uncharacterized protein n=1 Tax=Eumeta variegata TaxID=151549 RepID=A0A4C1VN74_EUMVA|nr:hypothetical protein EVAR_20295_1 [Eumeta japonica]